MPQSTAAYGQRSGAALTNVAPLDAQWARIGGGFTVAPSTDRVDLEPLLVASAAVAHADSRLFWMMTSWLAVHRSLVDARRLAQLLQRITNQSQHTDVADAGDETALASAAFGAALEVVQSFDKGATKWVVALQAHCRPLSVPRPLFDILVRDAVLTMVARDNSREEFTKWGLWQHEISDKRDAIRPIAGVWELAPELRIRSLLGASLEAHVISILQEQGIATGSDLAVLTGATRAAVHEAVATLAGRGLVAKPMEGYRKPISLSPLVSAWLAYYPASPSHASHRSRGMLASSTKSIVSVLP